MKQETTLPRANAELAAEYSKLMEKYEDYDFTLSYKESLELEKRIIEFKAEDLVSLSRFKQKIESIGNYIWLAKDNDPVKQTFLATVTPYWNQLMNYMK